MGTSDLMKYLQSRYGETCCEVRPGQVTKAAGTVRTEANNHSPNESLRKPEMVAGRLPPKTGEQVLRDRRSDLFQAKGVLQQDVDAIVERLSQRDRDMDNRISCAECRSFSNGRCQQARQPFGGGGVQILHRCKGFDFDD